MHPAPSLIAFTVLSGAGFGLMVFLGLGLPAATGWTAALWHALAFALAGGGLVASTLHLGHPERALLAFTQWRSSWLSREACLAVATLAIMALHGASALLGHRPPIFGALGAALAIATVTATAMIYAQLRAVPRWHHWTVPALFVVLSLSGGALLSGNGPIAAALLTAAGALMLAHWHIGDGALARTRSTPGTATGLAGQGAVRLFERPHTGDNYLTREMVFTVARRRAGALRAVALTLGIAIPALLALLPFGAWTLVPAAVLHLTGIAAQRWLFFAQAEHMVGLYYGRS
ncbi:MAG: dimethyl sulfoxide reductase anchor subunit [Rhodobacteraceae bacterium]|jgi:DMSO reductase anchor subunit|nr:dimethyl sulfoxide reductase anchor subunit [Paracoccaceae bacterium]